MVRNFAEHIDFYTLGQDIRRIALRKAWQRVGRGWRNKDRRLEVAHFIVKQRCGKRQAVIEDAALEAEFIVHRDFRTHDRDDATAALVVHEWPFVTSGRCKKGHGSRGPFEFGAKLPREVVGVNPLMDFRAGQQARDCYEAKVGQRRIRAVGDAAAVVGQRFMGDAGTGNQRQPVCCVVGSLAESGEAALPHGNNCSTPGTGAGGQAIQGEQAAKAAPLYDDVG